MSRNFCVDHLELFASNAVKWEPGRAGKKQKGHARHILAYCAVHNKTFPDIAPSCPWCNGELDEHDENFEDEEDICTCDFDEPENCPVHYPIDDGSDDGDDDGGGDD